MHSRRTARSLMAASLAVWTTWAAGQEAPAPADLQPAAGLTLEQAKHLALTGNPGLQALQERIQAAAALVGQARSSLYPQVTTRADIARMLESSVANGNIEDVTSYRANLSAQWLLFDGFARRHRIRAAAFGHGAAREEWEDARRTLLQGVAAAFLNTLLAEEIGRVSERDAAFNRELRLEAERRFAAGAGARADILNFAMREREAENRLTAAQRDTRTARTILATLLGRSEANLAPETVLLPSPPTDDADGIPAPEEALETAWARRPDLRQAEQVLGQAEEAELASRGTYLPAVGLLGEYSLSRLDNPRFRHERNADAFVGVAIGWDLFDGFRRRQAAAEAAANRRAAALQVTHRRIEIAAEVRRAVDAAETAAVQLENQRVITGMARELRDIARQEYAAGLVSLTRLNEVQTDLVRAEGALAMAGIRLEQAIEDLAAACAANSPAEP